MGYGDSPTGEATGQGALPNMGVALTGPNPPDGVRASPEQLLDLAPDGVVVVDGSGMIRLVNRQVEALFGYERSELIGQPVELLIPDRVRAIHLGHSERYFSAPKTRPMGAGVELSARRKDGAEFPADISLNSLQTDEGVLVSAAVRDVTERRVTEAKLKGLLEAGPDAIIAVDADGIIRLVNRQAESRFGYDDWLLAAIDEVLRSADQTRTEIVSAAGMLRHILALRATGRELVDIAEVLGSSGLTARQRVAAAYQRYEHAVAGLRADVIYALIEENGATLSGLARRMGIARQVVTRLYERGVERHRARTTRAEGP